MLSGYTKRNVIQVSKNFKSTEFDCKCKGYCSITLIDSKLVHCLQQIREHFNSPVIINSGFRCARHNRDVGGARGSQHLYGRAADIVVKGVKPSVVADYCEAIGMGGIGRYTTFTHIDVRDKKARWQG
jgi:uncharacterized protein YcbK (DUF882 family)